MTGFEMAELRRSAGLTQSALAEHIGVSRKTINEAEALGDGAVDRRTELALRALTLTSSVHARLIEDSKRSRVDGDVTSARMFESAANILRGKYATDEETIYNLARTAASYRSEAEALRNREYRRPVAQDD